MIADTGNRLFSAHAEAAFAAHPPYVDDGAAKWMPALWQDIEEAGFPLALLSEDQGGFGIDAGEALCLVRLAAAHAAPVPLAETMLANWLLAHAGLDLANGPATIASGLRIATTEGGYRLTGQVARVPYGRYAETLVALAGGDGGAVFLVRLSGGWSVTPGHNLAGEARDMLNFDTVLAENQARPAPVDAQGLTALGAVLRAQALAGALEAVMEKTVAYANDRVQFGRPIGKFQAIQQNLAIVAGQVAATRAGAEMATHMLPVALTDPARFRVFAGAAKLRAGEAAGIVADIAHQTHGAIGFTREYPLHPLTRRLWAWREEFGAEAFWADELGDVVLSLDPDGFWPFLTDTAGVAA